MNLTDYAWNVVESVSQKSPARIKLLISETEYPQLEVDSAGYVLRLSAPRLLSNNLWSLHGQYFNNDLGGKTSLWSAFRASLYHLSVHSVVTDYTIYGKEFDNRDRIDQNNLRFSISLVEDFAVRAFLAERYPGVMPDIAYANYLCDMRFKKNISGYDVATKLAANLLHYSILGRPIQGTMESWAEPLKASFDELCALEGRVRTLLASSAKAELDSIRDSKVKTVRLLTELFESESAFLSSIPSLTYTENYGPNYLFTNIDSSLSSSEDTTKNEGETRKESRFEFRGNKLWTGNSEYNLAEESQEILGDVENRLWTKQKRLSWYRDAIPSSHFEDYIFPQEDYAAFYRLRSGLLGRISSMTDQLWLVNFNLDEVQGKQSGYVDIPSALQVVASGSQRHDFFLRDELVKKNVAWAILIDTSKSFENAEVKVKDATVCLAEIANGLQRDPGSWACYAFNQNFYILKDFSESYDRRTKGRIGSLPMGIKTYLPDAINLATRKLCALPQEIKILIVVSDGYPLGYEGIEQELVSSIKKVSKSGVLLFGLGISNSAVRNYFTSNCEISDQYNLMKNFVQTYVCMSNSF